MLRPSSTAAPAEPQQASVAAIPEQQASAAASQNASSYTASHGREADRAPEAEEWRPFRPHEQKVAAALLVVLKKALKKGSDDLVGTKYSLISNNPVASHFLMLIPHDGELPSLKQLEAQATPVAREALALLSEHCAAVGWQPLEVFTRSAQCLTHLGALQNKQGSGRKLYARLQRLQALQMSLGMRCPAETRGGYADMAALLFHHGIAATMVTLILSVLGELSALLNADRLQLSARNIAGAHTSFSSCVDHMLPGEKADGVHTVFLLPQCLCPTLSSC